MTTISPKVERKVALIDEHQTILDAANLMVEKYIGSVVVTQGGKVTGIFTERDLMRAIARRQDPGQIKLREVMRTDLVRASPRDSVEQCLNNMQTHRCRHLLIFEGEQFVGIVSLRDLAALMLEEKEGLIKELTRYISG